MVEKVLGGFSFIPIPESAIANAIEILKTKEDHQEELKVYEMVLDAGKQYKEAGLTPLYLYNSDEQYLYATATELLDRKKLH